MFTERYRPGNTIDFMYKGEEFEGEIDKIDGSDIYIILDKHYIKDYENMDGKYPLIISSKNIIQSIKFNTLS